MSVTFNDKIYKTTCTRCEANLCYTHHDVILERETDYFSRYTVIIKCPSCELELEVDSEPFLWKINLS